MAVIGSGISGLSAAWLLHRLVSTVNDGFLVALLIHDLHTACFQYLSEYAVKLHSIRKLMYASFGYVYLSYLGVVMLL